MLSLILLLISPLTSLFTENPNYHPPKPEPHELTCGMTERQVKRMVGDPDRDRSCYDKYDQLIYGKNIIFFKDGYLVGQIKFKSKFDNCWDLTTETGFKSLCEDDNG